MSGDLTPLLVGIDSKATKVLNNLEALKDSQPRDTTIYDLLDKSVTDLRVERVALRSITGAKGVELRLIAFELDKISHDVDRAQEEFSADAPSTIFCCLKRRVPVDPAPNLPNTPLVLKQLDGDIDDLKKLLQGARRIHPSAVTVPSEDSQDRHKSSHCLSWSKQLRTARGLHERCAILQQDLPRADWAGFSSAIRGQDGDVYSELKIKRAERLAEWFYDTWNLEATTGPPDWTEPCPAKHVISNLAKICLILQTMQGQEYLTKFCRFHEEQRHDLTLPLTLEVLSTILADKPNEDRIFQAEQYRVFRRPHLREWERSKQPVSLLRYECLPYSVFDTARKGTHATVRLFRHVDDANKVYAIKEATDQQHYSDIRHEMTILRNLEPHAHVIKLVCVLERLGSPMLVLEPAATNDLQKFLRSFRNKNSGVDLTYSRKVLKTAFGCLSHGLKHIHKSTRHRDLKLDNILHVIGSDEKAKLIIADFGIAHHYGLGNASGTQNPWGFARRCTAPEVLKDDDRFKKTLSPAEFAPFEALKVSDGVHRHRHSGTIASQETDHDTASDIFSLGACFMDILSALVENDLPGTHLSQTDYVFAQHTSAVQQWAWEHEARQDTSRLKAAFHVARHMIAFKKSERWDLSRILLHLATPEAGGQMFCTAECQEKARELARAPSLNNANGATPLVHGIIDSKIEEETALGAPVQHKRSLTSPEQTKAAQKSDPPHIISNLPLIKAQERLRDWHDSMPIHSEPSTGTVALENDAFEGYVPKSTRSWKL